MPSVEILYKISIRLKVPFQSLFKALIYERQDYYDHLFEYLDLMSFHQNYIEIYTLCQSELKKKNAEDITNQILEYYTVSGYFLGNTSFKATLDQLDKLLESDVHYHHYSSETILINKANLYADQAMYNQAFTLYESVISEHKDCPNFNSFKIKVYYDQAIAFYKERKFYYSLDSIENGIKHSIKHHDMRYLGHLYKLKADNMTELSYDNENKQSTLLMADIFFELYDYNNHLKKARHRLNKIHS